MQIGADVSLPKANLEVDAGGAYVLPGLIDPHVHIGTGEEEEFTSQFRTESISAAISGVTTLLPNFVVNLDDTTARLQGGLHEI